MSAARPDDLRAWVDAAAAYDVFVAHDFRRAELLDPALIALLGEVRGLRIADLGCGVGLEAATLSAAGATIVAVDGVPAFVASASRALAKDPQSSARLWDLRTALPNSAPFEDASFDLVLAHMLVTSLPDLTPLFQSARRILKPSGRFIVTLLHPAFTPPAAKVHAGVLGRLNHRLRRTVVLNYFQELRTEKVVSESRVPPLPYYHRTLSTLLQSFGSAGFGITAAAEPKPRLHSQLAQQPRYVHTTRAPLFLLLEARPLQA